MSKAYLVESLSKQLDMSKAEAGRAVDAVFSSIATSLKKKKPVSIVGFGSFSVKRRAARTARNPQTGETIKLKAKNVPAFKAGKGLKEIVK